jgi:cell division protein FtsL
LTVATAARHAAAPAPRRDPEARAETPAYAYRAPRTRRRAAQRSRFMRTFIVFVACLTVLAVGRVALSFAVVQKTLQTEAVVREERRLSAQNDELREEVARLSSTVRISHIAESQLGLVYAGRNVSYPKPVGRTGARVASAP